MIRSRSDILRFEVLKLLNENPTHGYGLYLALKEQGLVNQASDLYKILDPMKKKLNLIRNVGEKKSDQGPSKVVLELTERGLEEYYDCLFSSAGVLIDFITEIFFKKSMQFDEKIRKRLIKNMIKPGDNVFLDIASSVPGRLLVKMLKQYLVSVDDDEFKAVTIFLENPKGIDQNLFKPLSKKVNIQILNETIALKNGTINYIFTLVRGSEKVFLNKINHLIPFLKKQGILIFLVTQQNPELNKMFAEFRHTLLEYVPDKFHDKLFEIIPSIDDDQLLSDPISAEHTLELLNKQFKNINSLSFEDVKIFVARNPKILKPILEQVQN